ncbi:MAG TPA: hypothetical protein PKN33_03670 [Phycisphaerae bacterium]|nr:hypothetical protein [Phycisphaerae bacterium]
MFKKFMCTAIVGTMLMVSSGCSATGAAWQAAGIGKNLSKKDSHLSLSLDGLDAKQNKLKKGFAGYAKYKIKGTVSTAPTFKFSFEDPTKFGRITGTNMQIHQAFEADYSHKAEFVITPKGSGEDSLMKPDRAYNLGSIGSEFTVLDFDGNNVGGVTLKPGMDYMLVFTISGDRSESMQVHFSTK